MESPSITKSPYPTLCPGRTIQQFSSFWLILFNYIKDSLVNEFRNPDWQHMLVPRHHRHLRLRKDLFQKLRVAGPYNPVLLALKDKDREIPPFH